MNSLYGVNGLMFWSEEEIFVRNMIQGYITSRLKNCLIGQNSAFQMFQCEAPLLIPRKHVDSGYGEEDIFITQVDDLVLRPETTPSSYLYAMELLNSHNEFKVKPPLVVWQHGRSARYEQDQVVKNMRLKEFYQLEFQIIFSDGTKNDYYPKITNAMWKAATELLGACYMEPSDRLPNYSEETTDLICERTKMEICSMSRRKDFPMAGLKVIEVAFGTDRCVYNFMNKG